MTQQTDLQQINGESMNLTDHNIEQLKQLFPNVFSEGKIDFEALKSELGNAVEELSGFGQIIVKRAYGDFSIEQLKNWKQPLNELAIQAKQQFAFTTGKNATDSQTKA